MRIRGNTVGFPNPQPNWNQTDTAQADYIKNKPAISVDAEGYTVVDNQRGLVSFSAVKNVNAVTVTSVYDGNKTHTDVITMDENDYPKKLVCDGKEIPLSWEGFE